MAIILLGIPQFSGLENEEPLSSPGHLHLARTPLLEFCSRGFI